MQETTTRAPARRYAVWAGAALLLAAAAYVANEEIKPRLFPKRFSPVIEDSLYRSGRIHPDLLPKVLREHGIDTIVTLTHEAQDHPWQKEEKRIAEELGVDIVRFPLQGNGTGDPASYQGALGRIHEELGSGRQVLVHCAAGAQRTGGAVFLYRTLVLGESPESAYADMVRHDFDPVDNPALLPYLRDITPQVRESLGDADITGVGRPLPAAYTEFFDSALSGG